MSFWVAGATLVGTVGAGYLASEGAKDAASAQSRSGDAAINEQRRQFDTLLNLTANQRGIGNQALNALGSIYGYQPAPGFSNEEYDPTQVNGLRSRQPVLMGDTELPPGATAESPGNRRGSDIYYNGQLIGRVNPGGPNGRFVPAAGVDINALWAQWEQAQQQARGAPDVRTPGVGGNQLAGPDYSAFYRSPDYQFRLGEGLNALQGSAAAAGGLYSGNTGRRITEYGQGLAAGEFGNYVNRQLALAGMGQAATTQAGNAALTTGTNVGNILLNQGNARASGIVGQTNAMIGGVNDLASLYGLWRGGYFGNSGGYNIQAPDAWGALDNALAGRP